MTHDVGFLDVVGQPKLPVVVIMIMIMIMIKKNIFNINWVFREFAKTMEKIQS